MLNLSRIFHCPNTFASKHWRWPQDENPPIPESSASPFYISYLTFDIPILVFVRTLVQQSGKLGNLSGKTSERSSFRINPQCNLWSSVHVPRYLRSLNFLVFVIRQSSRTRGRRMSNVSQDVSRSEHYLFGRIIFSTVRFSTAALYSALSGTL